MTRSERYRQYAEAARRRAGEAFAKANATYDEIPMGQPIITGRGSRTTADINRRERASRNMQRGIEESRKAEAWDYSAKRRRHYEDRLEAAQTSTNIEGVEVGAEVIASFTNSGNLYRFRGRIVRRTVNTWKVATLTRAPYGETPGRVFTIPAVGYDKRASDNNRVYALTDPNAPRQNRCPECAHPWAYHVHPSAQGRCRFPVNPDEFCGCEEKPEA